MNYKVIREIEVTDEQIAQIIRSAFDGVMTTQWCDMVVQGTPPNENTMNYSEDLTKGGTLKLQDYETSEWHELTLEKFLKALGERDIDLEDYDSIDADAVIQQAIFGKVVYG